MGPPIILDRSYKKSLTTDYEMENYYKWMANHNKTVHDLEVKKMFNAATQLSEPQEGGRPLIISSLFAL